ncbi:hypothetical protein CYMTET_50161 [Cymbomonas tetramitiformis]|uniref:Uncharacterized protein n=1 Tax=Cymbomonas tetramitiformis TaxID=36881 RepID=A0AAE0ET41_9CHLO|nr:hypothetical protein CYMTET_50161 [Cymbomonas tetramitiformis]
MRVPTEMVDPTFLTFLDRDDDGKANGVVPRTDTDTAELRLIRLTQHKSHTLNTQGFRAQRLGPDKKKKRTMARARERPRKTMSNRGMGNNYNNERQTAVSLLVNHEWRGTNLMSWLTRQNGGLLQQKFLMTNPGLIDGTDWQAVKARFGQSEVAVTFTGGECLTGKLVKFASRLRGVAAKLRFEKINESPRDSWATWVAKGLIRRPATCPVLYQFTLEQLVRVFEAVRANITWGQRAALRRKVCLAAKKAHGFPLRGVYVFKFPAAELWQKLDVRALARSALGQLRLDKRVRHFIIRRTSIVQTRGRKLTDLFCNFRDTAALPTSPPCMCHTASPFLPRNSEGHVCARTTDLNDPTLSYVLSRSLKDTPTCAVNYHTAAADAGLSYLSQFAAFSSRNEDEDLERFLPLGFDEKGTTYRAERNTDGW